MPSSSPKGRHSVFAWPVPRSEGAGKLDGDLIRRWFATDVWVRFQRLRGREVFLVQASDGFADGREAEGGAESGGDEDGGRRFLTELIASLRLTPPSDIFDTSAPPYYRLSQWVFIQLLERGLARYVTQNRSVCTSCALEAPTGRYLDCPHCGGTFEDRVVSRWYLWSEPFGERLLGDIDKARWTPQLRTRQRQFLTRRRGVEITFAVSRPFETEYSELRVFTTQCEAIYGATFLLVSPFNPLADELIDWAYTDEVEKYRDRLRRHDAPRRSATHTGGFAINPATLKRIPILLSPLADNAYSDGVVMGVPGHDPELFRLAKEMRLPIREVIHNDAAKFDSASRLTEAWTGDGVLTNSGPFTSLAVKVGRDRIIAFLGRRGICRRVTRFRFRRLPLSGRFSRGAPIPVIHCDRCGAVPVPTAALPRRADPDADTHAPCPQCGEASELDGQVILPWLGRAWSFLRAVSPHLDGELEGFARLSGEPDGGESDLQCDDEAETDGSAESREPGGEPELRAVEEESHPEAAEELEEAKDPTSAPEPASPPGDENGAVGDADDPGEPRSSEDRENPDDGDASRETESGARGPDDPSPPDDPPPPDDGDEPSRVESPGSGDGAEVEPERSETATSVAAPENEPASERRDRRRRANRRRAPSADEPKKLHPFLSEEHGFAPLPISMTFGPDSLTARDLLAVRLIAKILYDLGECPVYEPFHRYQRIARVRSTSGEEPDWMEWIRKYGADAVRLHVLSLGALHRPVTADEHGVFHKRKLLDRVRREILRRHEHGKFVSQRMLVAKHRLIDSVSRRLDRLQIHTAIAAVCHFVRFLGQKETTIEEMDSAALRTLVILLTPLVPDFAEEMWKKLGEESSVEDEEWPQASEELVQPDDVVVPVLVNGKIRDRMETSADWKAEKLEASALQRDIIREIVGPRRIRKVVAVPQRLVNIVLESDGPADDRPSGES